MTPEVARADRMQALREAAGDWLRAGWIDEGGRRAIESLYPDDRIRTGPAFRVLFFILTLGALVGIVGIAYAQSDSHILAATIAWIAGALCAAATNYLIGPLKRRQGGIEAALSLAAVANLTLAAAICLYEFNPVPDSLNMGLLLFFLAVLSSGAAWLWGYWPYAALSAYALFSTFLTLPAGRLMWALGVLAIYPWLIKGCDAGSLPPSHRKSVTAFLAVALLGLYAAIHVFALDHRSSLLGLGPVWRNRGELPVWLTASLTAMVPVAVVVIGIARRRRWCINLGCFLAVCSLLTLRYYFHVAPPWLLLTGAGVLLLVFAAVLRRFLDAGMGRERSGFTAVPFGEEQGRRRAVEIMAGVATLTPAAPAVTEKPQFEGGGGEFGGGGASGDF
jgi:hypothetical protein